MTIDEFRALPHKERYERGDRVLTWDRPSRPVLQGTVYGEFYRLGQRGVEIDRPSTISVTLPRWRVRLDPVPYMEERA